MILKIIKIIIRNKMYKIKSKESVRDLAEVYKNER